VAVIEHGPRVGRKILISGGGRCNFTNRTVRAENFLSRNPHFAKSALAGYTPEDFLALLAQHRIRTHEKTLGQLFCDNSATLVVEMLLAECAAAGVELLVDTRVDTVGHDGHFRVETSRGTFACGALVVATGGLSVPKLGATDLGYRLARQFGHAVVEPFPALTPLIVPGFVDLAGVSAEVVARCGGASFREKMLFTHRGLSGPAILQASSYWRAGEAIEIDLWPDGDLPGPSLSQRRARALLGERMPERLAERWLAANGFAQTTLSAARLNERLHRWEVRPTGTEGFEKAEVTGGGVDTAGLSSRTMESRLAPGLFFIGEVVDVTGQLGGYNFQWAWSSGHAAGEAV
jgi:predicted Rossmann fold flavoprotein